MFVSRLLNNADSRLLKRSSLSTALPLDSMFAIAFIPDQALKLDREAIMTRGEHSCPVLELLKDFIDDLA